MRSIPCPAQWVKGSGVATAVALIQSLAREFPYAKGVAKKKTKKQKNNNNKRSDGWLGLTGERGQWGQKDRDLERKTLFFLCFVFPDSGKPFFFSLKLSVIW